MTSTHPDPSARSRQMDAARAEARSAAGRCALDQGAAIISRPAFHGSDRIVQDVDPIAGLRAARDIELGAHSVARDYIRYAREAGHAWHEIGTALSLAPDRDAGETVADAAFSYTAGRPDTDHARSYGRSAIWTCRSCDQLISDAGPCNGPADDEHGHAKDCARQAAAIAAWSAQWEAEP